MKLTSEQCGLITEFSNNEGISLQTDYSGRGMYGKTCIGFVCDDPFSIGMKLAKMLIEKGENELFENMVSRNSMDNMGRSIIIYFPSVSWNEEVDDYEGENYKDEEWIDDEWDDEWNEEEQ